VLAKTPVPSSHLNALLRRGANRAVTGPHTTTE
jgi:hypothetical protein